MIWGSLAARIARSDRATVIRNISDGQYSNPVRVVLFNTAEGWSRDVSEDIAREMIDQASRYGLTFADLRRIEQDCGIDNRARRNK